MSPMTEGWLPYAAVSVLLLVFGLLGLTWGRTRKRALAAEAEAAAHGIDFYSQTGGARLDSFNVTIPFASIVVTPLRITLVVVGRDLRFDKSQIRSLSRHRGFVSTGLRIEHLRTEGPSYVVFWTTSFKELREALERLGYVCGP